MSHVGVTKISPVPREVWEQALRSDPGAVVTQSLAWRDAVFASGRLEDASVLYEFGSAGGCCCRWPGGAGCHPGPPRWGHGPRSGASAVRSARRAS